MQLYVSLTKAEMTTLVELARIKRRRPQEQAAMLIADALRNQTRSHHRAIPFAIATPVADEQEVADDA